MSYTHKPKMILFDYGGTLIYEPDFNPHGGNAAIYPYINENPHNISLQEFSNYLLKLFDEIRALRGELIEIHEHIFLNYVLEHFAMKLSVPIEIVNIT
jgi:putative hydrolase of the HAD superfamily